MSKRRVRYVDVDLRLDADLIDWLVEVKDMKILGNTLDAVIEHMLRQYLWTTALDGALRDRGKVRQRSGAVGSSTGS